MSRFSTEQLCLARSLRAMSQNELASRILVSQGTMSKIENGQLEPAPVLVDKISQALDIPNSFFFEYVEYTAPSSTLLFRRRASLSQTTLKSIGAKIAIIRFHVAKMLKSFDVSDIPIKKLALGNWKRTPFDSVQFCKSVLAVPPGPIRNMTAIVERAGIVIIPTVFPTREIDGVYVHDDLGLPIVVLNQDVPGDRWRWTLAHELAHAIMHMGSLNYEDDQAEQEANTFASEFLMPQDQIRGSLAVGLDLRKLAGLKAHWKVSMQALIMRASDIGCISEYQKRRLFTKMSALRIRHEEPGRFEREQPILLSSLFEQYMSQHNLSFEDLFDDLKISPADFANFYPGIQRPKPQLTLF